jgi:hypothetical protein
MISASSWVTYCCVEVFKSIFYLMGLGFDLGLHSCKALTLLLCSGYFGDGQLFAHNQQELQYS